MRLSIRLVCWVVAGLSLVLWTPGCATAVKLVENGKSSHQIVLQTDASPSEKFAAEELQTHFKACTGIELPIVDKAPSQTCP
jgi:hypothetical protein